MKNLSRTLVYVSVAITLVWITGCKIFEASEGYDHKCAEIRPGWEVSKTGCATVDQILAKYDKSLYRIQTFKKGKLVKEKGTLSPDYMPYGRIAQVAKEARDLKFTGCAIQAGRCSKGSSSTKGTSSTNPVAIKTSQDFEKLEQVLKNNH
jgi:hypothetical protein